MKSTKCPTVQISGNIYSKIASAAKADPTSVRHIRSSNFDAAFFFFAGVDEEGGGLPLLVLVLAPELEPLLEVADFPVMDAFRAAESESKAAKAASGSVICEGSSISTDLSRRERERRRAYV